jgi:UDP:flavonoid glycosyltransferase YjiC (YdhE family)
MDQFLNMRTIENYGAGLLVRSDHTNTSSLRKTVQTLMTSPQFTERARALAQSLPEELPGLENFITRLLGRCAPITQNDATKMPIAST